MKTNATNDARATCHENLIESANAVITAMAALDRAIAKMPDHLISEAQCIRGALLVEAANRIDALDKRAQTAWIGG